MLREAVEIDSRTRSLEPLSNDTRRSERKKFHESLPSRVSPIGRSAAILSRTWAMVPLSRAYTEFCLPPPHRFGFLLNQPHRNLLHVFDALAPCGSKKHWRVCA